MPGIKIRSSFFWPSFYFYFPQLEQNLHNQSKPRSLLGLFNSSNFTEPLLPLPSATRLRSQGFPCL